MALHSWRSRGRCLPMIVIRRGISQALSLLIQVPVHRKNSSCLPIIGGDSLTIITLIIGWRGFSFNKLFEHYSVTKPLHMELQSSDLLHPHIWQPCKSVKFRKLQIEWVSNTAFDCWQKNKGKQTTCDPSASKHSYFIWSFREHAYDHQNESKIEWGTRRIFLE
jgi:hypothetical protein